MCVGIYILSSSVCIRKSLVRDLYRLIVMCVGHSWWNLGANKFRGNWFLDRFLYLLLLSMYGKHANRQTAQRPEKVYKH